MADPKDQMVEEAIQRISDSFDVPREVLGTPHRDLRPESGRTEVSDG